MAKRPDQPTFFTESVREHVRGGYNEDRGAPVIVLAEGVIKGCWYPGTSGLSIDFPGRGALTPPATNGATARSASAHPRSVRPVPKPSQRKARP